MPDILETIDPGGRRRLTAPVAGFYRVGPDIASNPEWRPNTEIRWTSELWDDQRDVSPD